MKRYAAQRRYKKLFITMYTVKLLWANQTKNRNLTTPNDFVFFTCNWHSQCKSKGFFFGTTLDG